MQPQKKQRYCLSVEHNRILLSNIYVKNNYCILLEMHLLPWSLRERLFKNYLVFNRKTIAKIPFPRQQEKSFNLINWW